MELRNATRKQAKIKLALQGPAGSGKTYSALLLAFGLTNAWNNIAIIDTENHSADLYAHLGNFNVLSLDKPFSPERYIEAIELCEKAGMEVIILDSITHEWDGSGGILDVHQAMTGNSFTNWSKVTPRHNAFVQKFLQSECHIIATIRTKQDYVLSEKNGKMVPTLLQVAPLSEPSIQKVMSRNCRSSAMNTRSPLPALVSAAMAMPPSRNMAIEVRACRVAIR